ncbi:MAG: CHAP domain-containing protein [Alphaproteobacteria bacterium]|nr:CHAP domain-containing protein [Alphaproteobacteria bacterium]
MRGRIVLGAGLAGLMLASCASIQYEASYGPPPQRVGPSTATLPGVFADGPPVIVHEARRQQCVPFARTLSGVQIFGDAHTWWSQAAGRYPRSGLPAPGAVLVLEGYNTPYRGHVAVVTAVVSGRELRVDQANWLNSEEVTVRVPVRDVSPNNDWSQIRMWHIPTRAWGARIYRVQGFIHPLPLTLAASS